MRSYVSLRCLSLFGATLLALTLAVSSSSAGPLVTLNYAETNCDFRWSFKFVKPYEDAGSSLVVNSNKWDLRADTLKAPESGDDVLDLKVAAQHRALTEVNRCHSVDMLSGEAWSVTKFGISSYDISAVDKLIDWNEKDHPLLRGTHFDLFQLYYNKPQTLPVPILRLEDVIFTLVGNHRETSIPEPSSILLLIVGLLGLARHGSRLFNP